MKIIYVLLACFYCLSAFAEKSTPAGESTPAPKEEKVAATESKTEPQSHDQYFNLGLMYSFIDLWVTPKWGIDLAYRTKDVEWEFEYTNGTLSYDFLIDDIGIIKEERFTLNRKSFAGDSSFYWAFGLYYSQFEAKIGASYLSSITSSLTAQANLLTIRSVGIMSGIGNKWNLSRRFYLGIDWFQIFAPIYNIETDSDFFKYSTDSSDRDKVDKALKFVKYIPGFVLFKLSLGFNF
jgi:hypothetical protein